MWKDVCLVGSMWVSSSFVGHGAVFQARCRWRVRLGKRVARQRGGARTAGNATRRWPAGLEIVMEFLGNVVVFGKVRDCWDSGLLRQSLRLCRSPQTQNPNSLLYSVKATLTGSARPVRPLTALPDLAVASATPRSGALSSIKRSRALTCHFSLDRVLLTVVCCHRQ